METLIDLLPTVVAASTVLIVVWFGNRLLRRYFDERPQLKYRRQLYQIAGVLLAILLLILSFTMTENASQLRGQLLNFYAIIVSATIALSSTTLIGNILAGIMLKSIGNCRPGDYITVGDHFGRISEMDLLHTEIQTEERDLTTLPNLYLVTKPVRVMRSSGTVISVEVSLGYDVSRHRVEKLLLKAADETELESPFVQIRDLGDHSVTYRIAGLLTEVKRLLEKRRQLRGRTLDVFHAEGIEVVSPTFMNTRALQEHQTFIADVDVPAAPKRSKSADSVVFDKAHKAQSVENLRDALAEAEDRIRACNGIIADSDDDQTVEEVKAEISGLEERIERINALIEAKEAKISKD